MLTGSIGLAGIYTLLGLSYFFEFKGFIMMDLKMPLLNGVEATKLIHKDFPAIRIIALTSYNTKSL
jgi:CheY-like chemotaxis protein